MDGKLTDPDRRHAAMAYAVLRGRDTGCWYILGYDPTKSDNWGRIDPADSNAHDNYWTDVVEEPQMVQEWVRGTDPVPGLRVRLATVRTVRAYDAPFIKVSPDIKQFVGYFHFPSDTATKPLTNVSDWARLRELEP